MSSWKEIGDFLPCGKLTLKHAWVPPALQTAIDIKGNSMWLPLITTKLSPVFNPLWRNPDTTNFMLLNNWLYVIDLPVDTSVYKNNNKS